MTNNLQTFRLSQVKWLVLLSYFFVLTLDAINLIGEKIDSFWSLMPLMSLLLLFFWMTKILNRNHLITAFILGLLIDALTNSLLGTHAAIFSLLSFFMLRQRWSFKSYPLWHQAILIGFYIFVFQVLEGFFLSLPLLGFWDLVWLYLLKALFAAFLWPILTHLMNWVLVKTH